MRRAISFVLSLIIVVGICTGLPFAKIEVSAVNGSDIFTVKTSGFEDGKLIYTIYLNAKVTLSGTVVHAKFDSSVLELVSAGSYQVDDGNGGTRANVSGMYETGYFHDTNDSRYCIGYTYTGKNDYNVGSKAKAFMQFTFKAINPDRPEAKVDFLCWEFSSVNTPSNNIPCDSNVLISSLSSIHDHSYGDWVLEKDATCTEKGNKYKICATCDKKINEEIPVIGHSYSLEWTTDIEPTCTTTGSKSKHCTVCDEKTDITTIDALSPETGCSFGLWQVEKEPTCTTEGIQARNCMVCGRTEKSAIACLPHVLSDWIITLKPTCTENGEKIKKCTVCNTVISSSIIDVSAHNFGEIEIITPSTCTNNGIGKHSCIDCGITDYVSTPPKHSSSNWVIEKSTVYRAGMKYKECTECGEVLEVVLIPQLKPEAPRISNATNTASGVKITWGKVEGADDYIVLRRTYDAKTKKWSLWSKLQEGVTSTSYLDKTAKSGVYYVYTVKSNNEAGYSSHRSGFKTYFLSTPKITLPHLTVIALFVLAVEVILGVERKYFLKPDLWLL